MIKLAGYYSAIIDICRSRETIYLHPLHPLVAVKTNSGVAVLATLGTYEGCSWGTRHTLFLWSVFSSTSTSCVTSYCDSPSFTVCLQASLSVAATSQESMFMPSALRSHLHMSWKRSCGRPVGLFPFASSPH